MKKLLLGAAMLLGGISLNAQDGPQIGKDDATYTDCIRMLRNMVFTLCGDGIPLWVIKVMERLVQTLVEWLLLPMEQKC